MPRCDALPTLAIDEVLPTLWHAMSEGDVWLVDTTTAEIGKDWERVVSIGMATRTVGDGCVVRVVAALGYG